MRLLIGLLSYLIATAGIVAGAVAILFFAVEPAATMASVQQEKPKVAPRIQEWLDRKAEARAYAEREKAAAAAEKERAEQRRAKISTTTAYDAFARAPDHDDKKAVGRERAARTKQSAKRDARRSRPLPEGGAPRASPQQAMQYYPDLHGRSY